jgi:hypothetical protein
MGESHALAARLHNDAADAHSKMANQMVTDRARQTQQQELRQNHLVTNSLPQQPQPIYLGQGIVPPPGGYVNPPTANVRSDGFDEDDLLPLPTWNSAYNLLHDPAIALNRRTEPVNNLAQSLQKPSYMHPDAPLPLPSLLGPYPGLATRLIRLTQAAPYLVKEVFLEGIIPVLGNFLSSV